MRLGSSEEDFEKETGVNKKVFPYGIHKDKEFSKIPFQYLYWVYEEHDLKGWLRETVDNEVMLRIGDKDLCFTTYLTTSLDGSGICDACDIQKVCKGIDLRNNPDAEEEEEDFNFPWDE